MECGGRADCCWRGKLALELLNFALCLIAGLLQSLEAKLLQLLRRAKGQWFRRPAARILSLVMVLSCWSSARRASFSASACCARWALSTDSFVRLAGAAGGIGAFRIAAIWACCAGRAGICPNIPNATGGFVGSLDVAEIP